jgi:hypothetical protein
MDSPLNLWGVVLIIGAAQGIFLAVFLVRHKINHIANRFLALFLVIAAIAIATPELVRKYYAILPHLIGATFTINFILGPALFLYTRSLSCWEFSFPRRWFLHFLPFLICTFYLLPFYFQSGNAKIAFFRNVITQVLPRDFIVIDWHASMSSCIPL